MAVQHRLFILGCLLAAPLAARGEIVVLKTGGQVEGEVTNGGRTAKDPVELTTPLGVKLSFAADQVQRLIVKSDAERQYDLLAPQTPDTVDAQWDLADWCRQAGLNVLRQKHLDAVLRLDPEHEKARLALGFQKFGGQWTKPDEWMRNQGYVKYQGMWRLRQEVELDVRLRQAELADKTWRQKLKTWKDQLSKARYSESARQNIQAIRDPAAAAGLLDIVKDVEEPRELRLMCLELITKMSGNIGTGLMIQLALNDADAGIRDKCLEELKNRRSAEAVAAFTKLLKDKKNSTVNRAALCLERMDDSDATLPLIEALVTNHTYWVSPGGGPGQMSATFSKNDAGSAPGGPLGGMGMGGKPKMVKKDEQNGAVLGALTHLNPGVNFSFDKDRWRQWYTETYTTTKVNLRRD